MDTRERTLSGRLRTLAAAALLVGVVTACHGNILDVRDPDVVTPSQLTGPGAVSPLNAGVINDFRVSYDSYALSSGLLGDEFELSGTFSTRIPMDERNMQPDNGSISPDVYQPVMVSVASADNAAKLLSAAVSDPDFAEILGAVREGLARAQLFGAYGRMFLAEGFCQSILSNPVTESAPLGSRDRAADALALFQKAEATANDVGLASVADAAIVGQGRALMFLGRYDEAGQAVSSVPVDFVLTVAHSTNQDAERNPIYDLTWGDQQALRWTVGNGTDVDRHLEKWPFYDEWVDQGLLIPPDQHSKTAFNGSSPVSLQTEYGGQDPGGAGPSRTGAGPAAPIVVASGWEAQMIRAEAELRSGQLAAAESRVNALLTDAGQADNPIRRLNPNVPFGAFGPVSLSPDSALEANLRQIGRARAAGMWLQGQRQGFTRRLILNDGAAYDFYPQGTEGSDIAFPIPSQEFDNNPNIARSCPAGPPWGYQP